jgi:hypothetical protein
MRTETCFSSHFSALAFYFLLPRHQGAISCGTGSKPQLLSRKMREFDSFSLNIAHLSLVQYLSLIGSVLICVAVKIYLTLRQCYLSLPYST